MQELQLLEVIHLGLLRDLARSVRSGTAGHQELAIARGLLRDNKKVVPAEPDDQDGELPEHGGKVPLPAREWGTYEHDE